jgi:hypothetical protein
MSVIALVTDLIFGTKIGGTARSLNLPLSIPCARSIDSAKRPRTGWPSST